MSIKRWTALATGVLCVAMGGAPELVAQGVTTGAVTGEVTGPAGPVQGATVTAVNASTGFRSAVQTRPNGLYSLQGLEAGTYTVAARGIGYRPVQRLNIIVRATQATRVNFTLERQTVELQAVTVSAARTDADFGPARTGARNDVSDTLVRRLPNLNRNLTDFVQLTPQATSNPNSRAVTSFAGQNNRYNNIQVDGLTQVDRFGLGSDQQIGGQANGRGLTLEAVKEVQVLVSPFDVRQGNFTGGLTNVITRNGTNDFQGSFAAYYRNQSFAQNDPFIRNNRNNRAQYAGSLSGPIVRDRVHYFVAADVTRAEAPAAGPYFGQAANSPTPVPVSQASVDRFTQLLQRYGVAAGSPGQVTNTTPLTNTFARVDFNFGPVHRLVVRNNYNRNLSNDFSRSTATTNPLFDLSSQAFQRRDISNSLGAQLFSNFRNGWANEFQVGYNLQRFERVPSIPAGQFTVENLPNVAGGTARLRAGTDSSSQINQLDQDIVEIVDNLTIPAGRHTLTIGSRNEFYKARNFFAQAFRGSWSFANLDSLDRGVAQSYAVSGSLGGDIQARFRAGTFGGYVQDLWQVNDRLSLNLGLRADLVNFFTTPLYTPEVERTFGRRTNQLPKNQLNLSPRLGFNYDVAGNQQTQLRGGAGVFLGQPPYVFLSNNYTNTGRNLGILTCDPRQGRPAPPAFTPEAAVNPPQTCGNGAGLAPGAQLGVINTIDPNVRYPQVLRANLGVDRQLPLNLIGTLEALYTYGINDFFYVRPILGDSTRADPTGPRGVDRNGRLLYGRVAPATGALTPVLRSAQFSDVIDARNASGSYSYNLTAQLRRRFVTRWEGSVAYTYQQARSVQDLTSSVARSNWNNGRATAGNQYSTALGISAFQVPHRLIATGTYSLPWKAGLSTDLSFIYSGQSGTPVTWTASGAGGALNGDLNGDGAQNDPIYVPRNATNPAEIQFRAGSFRDPGNPSAPLVTFTAAEQAVAFERFIQGQACLREQRGQILARNSCRNPWVNQLDVSLRQTLPTLGTNRLSLQADAFNFLNLLNRDWGRNRSRGQFPTQGILRQVGIVPGTANDPQTLFDFNPYEAEEPFRRIQDPNQFYQIQISARYAF